MATVTVLEPSETFWARVGQRLRSWGQKIKNVAVRFGNWIKRGAQWLWNTKAIQWVVDKTKLVATKTWSVLRGPVGWVLAPIAAIIFAPKAVAVMLLLVGLAIGLLVFMTWRLTKLVKERTGEEIVDILGGPLAVEYNSPVEEDETAESRFTFLDAQQRLASDAGDDGAFSELLGRLYLIRIRESQEKESKLARNSSPSKIYRECKEQVQRRFPGETQWDFGRMYNAIRNEDKRYKDREELKAKTTVSV